MRPIRRHPGTVTDPNGMMIIVLLIDHHLRVGRRPLAITGQGGMAPGPVTDRQVTIAIGWVPAHQEGIGRHLDKVLAPSL